MNRINSINDFNEEGQSILEVLFLFPVLFLFVSLLYRMNMATLTAINHTQFSRSQMFVLSSNWPEYPRIYFRRTLMVPNQQDRMVLGVADPSALVSSNYNDTSIDPIPQIQTVGRKNTTVKGSDATGEVTNRTAIRIRNTTAICTQLNSVNSKSKTMLDSDGALELSGDSRWPFGQKVCQYPGDTTI